MLSVVIPLYNKEKFIVETLKSVLNQTFKNFEIVIVDDGCTDNSVNEIKKIQDTRIRIIHQKNQGVSAARNAGIQAAKYDWVALMDSDDLWKEEYLETQIELHRKYPNCNVLVCNYEFRSPRGKVSYPIINKCQFIANDGIINNYFEICSNSSPLITSISIVVRKKSLIDIGGFPVGVKSGEDLLTWAWLAINNSIAYSKQSLAIYRQGHSIPRPPETIDSVGEQLEKLYISHSTVASIKQYVAFWYKMRMCRCLSYRMYDKAFRAFIKSLTFYPLQWKIYFSAIYYLFK